MKFSLFKRRSEDLSAAELYTACLKQSRRAEFYAPQSDGYLGVPDDYDGRVSWLTVHLTLVMHRLRDFGDAGLTLNQALYDIMVEDFNIALREEGLADTGIARRIKPMVALFLTLTKDYTEVFADNAPLTPLVSRTLISGENRQAVTDRFAAYIQESKAKIATLDFDTLTSSQVTFAEF